MLTNMPKPPALDNTYGALLLGTVFGTMSQHLLANTINVIEFLVIRLYGLMVHQTYRYYRLYPKDRFWIKSLVSGIALFETLHTTLCIVAVYSQSLKLLASAAGPTIVLCQCFYVYRVYRLGSHYGYKLLVSIPIACMVCEVAFIVATTVEAFRLSLTQFPPFGWLASAAFGCAALAELFLTGTLIIVLLRTRTGFKKTDSTIEVMIIYAINTGLLTRYRLEMLAITVDVVLTLFWSILPASSTRSASYLKPDLWGIRFRGSKVIRELGASRPELPAVAIRAHDARY
ncbi:hypothetical protein ONZ51_g4031 [Trametes cubensis]|uniref:Uncharacterized protein n=1 Tax=Trametes cubensis TaxID=1111947 RepID=A0AAD7TX47_9APHY|nr:hypothetical protein ONZ51_g4031 [Trametes cubensis]